MDLTVSGGMPGPLSLTRIISSSTVIVISGEDAGLFTGVQRVIRELFHNNQRPVLRTVPGLNGQLLDRP
jgi:hypothetical protein